MRCAGALCVYSVHVPKEGIIPARLCFVPCNHHSTIDAWRSTSESDRSCLPLAWQVIRRANQSQFGLASGLWAKDIDVVNTVSRGLRAGTVWVNCCEPLTCGLWDAYSACVGLMNYPCLFACTAAVVWYMLVESSIYRPWDLNRSVPVQTTCMMRRCHLAGTRCALRHPVVFLCCKELCSSQ